MNRLHTDVMVCRHEQAGIAFRKLCELCEPRPPESCLTHMLFTIDVNDYNDMTWRSWHEHSLPVQSSN